MKQIVGVMIGTKITNNRDHIATALEMDLPVQFLDRLHMEFMSKMDLGAQWGDMASGPTLFLMDDDGQVYPAQPQKRQTDESLP